MTLVPHKCIIKVMYSVKVEVENETDRSFKVLVASGSDHGHSYLVHVSSKTMDRFDFDESDLPDVIENAFYFLLERESPQEILPSFELMAIASYFPEFTPGIDT